MSRFMPAMAYKGIVLILLWLTGFYLRLPILVAPPLIPGMNVDFNLNESVLGTLTTLPVLMLGLGALPATVLIGRIGARNTVILTLLVAVIASGLRGMAPGIGLLLLLTAIMGLGIAAMQTALPALVPRWCPGFMALASTLYLNGMMMGEFAGAGLTLPWIMPLVGNSWRYAMVAWSVPGILLALALFYPRLQGQPQARTSLRKSLPRFGDRQMWVFGLLQGTASVTFFGVNAYMASVLREKGMPDWLGLMLFMLNLSQVIASLIMVVLARRVLVLPRLQFVAVSCISVGLVGFMLLSGALSVAAIMVLSFASSLQLISLVTLPPLLRSPQDAGKLAAGMFALGYILAFAVPLGMGVLADLFGSTRDALWLIVLFNVLCLPLAWRTRVNLSASSPAGADAATESIQENA